MTTSAESVPWADPQAASARVGELYEAHGRMVVGLCRFLLRDPVEAEDAAQQSFVAAHRSLLRGSVPHDAPAWLATIARNECRARIKQRMREPLALFEPDGSEGEVPDPFHAAVENADLKALRAGLEALPPAQRNAFVLREFAGLSYDELSVALGVSAPAVESLLVRARTKLRLALVHANPLVIPVFLRDQITRLATGGFDDGSAGAIAKLASLPVAAKLAAAGAGVALVAVGGSAVERPRGGDRLAPAGTAIVAPAGQRSGPVSIVRGVSEPSRTASGSTVRGHDGAAAEDLHAGSSGGSNDSGRGASGRDDSSSGSSDHGAPSGSSSSGPGSGSSDGDGDSHSNGPSGDDAAPTAAAPDASGKSGDDARGGGDKDSSSGSGDGESAGSGEDGGASGSGDPESSDSGASGSLPAALSEDESSSGGSGSGDAPASGDGSGSGSGSSDGSGHGSDGSTDG